MSCTEKWNFLFNFLTAFGTAGAVILALFGDFFKNLIFRAKISVEIVDPNGELTNWSSGPLPSMPTSGTSGYSSTGAPVTSSFAVPMGTSGTSGYAAPIAPVAGTIGPAVIYYHLRLINRRTCVDIKKCKVSLKEIHLKAAGATSFTQLPLNVPPKFFWAPAESSPQAIDIVTDQILDFGYIVQGSNLFTPAIWPRFNNFKGDLKPNETFKYVLEIIANNLSPKKVTIEVSWNGNWSTNLNTMATGFKIKII